VTTIHRPATSDVTPEETLSYRDQLGEPHFTGKHLLEDNAFLITGETDDYLRLFRLFAPTLNLLILKNKIRDAVRPPAEVRAKRKAV